jgi:hypothetical protein
MDGVADRLGAQHSPKRLPGDKIRIQTKDQPLTALSTAFGQAKGFGTPATSSGTGLFGQPTATATSSGAFGFGPQPTPFGASSNSGGLFGGQKTGFGASSKSSEEHHIFYLGLSMSSTLEPHVSEALIHIYSDKVIANLPISNSTKSIRREFCDD